MKVKIVIPTFNGGELWRMVAKRVVEITKNEKYINGVLIIDSGSSDSTTQISKQSGFDVHSISSEEFNHGGTRNLGVTLSGSDIVIFLTQDALPTKNSFANIIMPFKDLTVAAAYGRQTPHDNATPIAIHARQFNYKEESYISEINAKKTLGIKTVFLSNSFSAYRTSIFNDLGGFPNNTILGEDMFFAAKAILSGYKIAYAADAIVQHSHNYTLVAEFKRYFDIGVFHNDEKWIRENFGGAGGEGKRFIISEFKHLLRNKPLLVPLACANNFAKIVGYKLGQNYQKLPKYFIKKLSMHKRYW
ncbi:glycosyltransferase family 2 protein [Sodalis sp. RH21]|uniref:glycosyltransferase family 2 protein n=1 Tax=unclassified Sodalis (in: enterobacteria) TaxID=2636512 RepID=UPI0039B5F71B